MNRAELERLAAESAPADLYYDLMDKMGDLPDATLWAIVNDELDFEEGDE